MISMPSVVSALMLYSFALFLVCVARVTFIRPLMLHGGAFILLSASAVATLRLLLPLEIQQLSRLRRSWNLLGTPVRILRTYPELERILLMVWVAGGIVFLCWDAFTLYRAYKRSGSYQIVEDERVQEIAERLAIPYRVVVSPDVGVPYVEGIFHHVIYLPVLNFSQQNMEFVLLHEVQHIRNHDSIIKFFFRLLLVVMWWNPIAHWFWFSTLDDLLELRCDGKVTKYMSHPERRAYGEMLKEMAETLVKKKPMSPLAVDEFLVVGRNKFITQRMKVVLKGSSEPTRAESVVVYCALLALFFASYLVIFQPAGMPLEDRFEEKTGVQYYEAYNGVESDSEICSTFIFKGSDGQYQLFIDYELTGFLTEDEVNSDKYRDLVVFEEGKQE